MSGSLDLSALERRLADRMRSAQRGDSTAYRELLLEVRPILQNYLQRGLRRMGSHDPGAAEDLVQETLLALHDKRSTYDPSQLFTPWIYAIARYKLIDSGRKRKREAPVEEIGFFESIPAPESGSPDGMAETDVDTLLATLPARQREVLELAKLQGLSMEEVASKTGMTVGNAKVTVHRALKSLRSKLGKDVRS